MYSIKFVSGGVHYNCIILFKNGKAVGMLIYANENNNP